MAQVAGAATGDGVAGRKINYFEWARAFGALGIVILHTCIATWNGVPSPGLGTERLIAHRIVGTVCSRWCVPVFLMVSGVLLLDPARDMPLSKLRRHIGRMLFVICTFGLAFGVMQEYVDEGGLSWAVVWTGLRDVLYQQSWDHLWYVYAMVGIYALTPLFRAFVARASHEEHRWVLGFLLAFGFAVPLANDEFGWELTSFYLTIPSCFTYCLLGYYVHTYLRFNWRWGVGGLVSLAAMVALVVWGTPASNVDVGQLYAPESPLLCAYAVMVFLALRRLLDAVPIARHRFFATIARHSFGIYIVHPLFGHLAVLLANPLDYPAGLYELVVIVVSVAGSVALTWLLKHLPGFRRVL